MPFKPHILTEKDFKRGYVNERAYTLLGIFAEVHLECALFSVESLYVPKNLPGFHNHDNIFRQMIEKNLLRHRGHHYKIEVDTFNFNKLC